MGVRAVGKNSSQLRQQRDPKFHARRPSPAFSYLRTPSACPPRCHILHSEHAPRDASLPLPYSLPQIPQEHLATLHVTCQVMSKDTSTTWKFPQLLVQLLADPCGTARRLTSQAASQPKLALLTQGNSLSWLRDVSGPPQGADAACPGAVLRQGRAAPALPCSRGGGCSHGSRQGYTAPSAALAGG